MLAYGGRLDRFRRDWQFHDEAGADWPVFLHANGAVMIFDNAAHNGEA